MTNTVKLLKVANRDQCIGCFSCMYACSRILRAHGGTEKAALRVRSYAGVEGAFSLRVCARCEEPDCAEACPKGALKLRAGGGVLLKRELCTSCRKCVKGCKISALQWDFEGEIPMPCSHCGQCVKYCPNGVIVMAEREPQNAPDVSETGAVS